MRRAKTTVSFFLRAPKFNQTHKPFTPILNNKLQYGEDQRIKVPTSLHTHISNTDSVAHKTQINKNSIKPSLRNQYQPNSNPNTQQTTKKIGCECEKQKIPHIRFKMPQLPKSNNTTAPGQNTKSQNNKPIRSEIHAEQHNHSAIQKVEYLREYRSSDRSTTPRIASSTTLLSPCKLYRIENEQAKRRNSSLRREMALRNIK